MDSARTYTDDRVRIREAIPIESLVGEYVSLKPDGKNLKALCPFHTEKTPSFKVDPVSGNYRCFGCGERGDIFSFVMKIEGLEFRDALERLAERAGIALAPWGGSGASAERGVRYSVSERRKDLDAAALADRWFRQEYARPSGATARAYMEGRGFTKETVERFTIGFAPDGWTGLVAELARCGCDTSRAIAVGLIRPGKSGGSFDMFRNRIMFPIRNLSGHLVGFGGRVLPGVNRATDGERERTEPKYINSPESTLFKKGQLLYGHFEGRETIRRERELLLMEGYTDVMMAHQSGFPNAVATLGTALTEHNVELLVRHADRIVLVFDGDEAGRRAARKAVPLFFHHAIDLRVVLIEGAKDPCDLLRGENGSAAFRRLLDAAPDSLEFLLSEIIEESGRESGEQKVRTLREFWALLQQVPSEIRRRSGLELLADRLQIPLARVEAECARVTSSTPVRGRQQAPKPAAPATTRYFDEEALLTVAIQKRADGLLLLDLIEADEFAQGPHREIARILRVGRGEIDALDIEDPEAKTRYLQLREAVDASQFDEERAERLLADYLTHVLDGRGRELRSRVEASFGLAGEDSEGARYMQHWTELQRLRCTIRECGPGSWKLLCDIAAQVMQRDPLRAV